ncbi:MAG TPA: hypothetical protein VI456_05560 [Polyangia bacterium]
MSSCTSLGLVWGVLVLASGCAHHRVVGRPPTAAEIEAINRAGDGPRPMTLYYADPEHPCGGGVCAIDGGRPISDTPPLQIERILDADERRVTVVAQTGERWNLDLSALAGVSTRSRAAGDGSVVGGVVGLALGGAVVFLAYFFSGSPADAPENERSQPLSAPAAIGTCLISTAVGMAIGAIAGDHVIRTATFDFGGGHLAAPTAFSR